MAVLLRIQYVFLGGICTAVRNKMRDYCSNYVVHTTDYTALISRNSLASISHSIYLDLPTNFSPVKLIVEDMFITSLLDHKILRQLEVEEEQCELHSTKQQVLVKPTNLKLPHHNHLY